MEQIKAARYMRVEYVDCTCAGTYDAATTPKIEDKESGDCFIHISNLNYMYMYSRWRLIYYTRMSVVTDRWIDLYLDNRPRNN